MQAAKIGTLVIPTKWQLFRKKLDDNSIKFLGEFSRDVVKIRDFGIANNTNYKYLLFPVTQNQMGYSLESNMVLTKWWFYSITDAITKETFTFYLDVASSDNKVIADRAEYMGFTQFNKVSVGSRNYISGSLNCLISNLDTNCEVVDTIDLRDKLRSCINNGNSKILKNRKGDVWLVDTYDFNFKFRDEFHEQLQDISFSFIQIGLDDTCVLTTNGVNYPPQWTFPITPVEPFNSWIDNSVWRD